MTTSARDAMWLLFILIVIGVIWSAQREGGILGIFPGSGPKLSPSGTTQTTTNPRTSERTRTTIRESSPSPALSINIAAAKNAKPEEEYIIIKNAGAEKINLSNLEFKNKNNESEFSGADQNGNQIFLNPKERAVASSGKSPVSGNLKINKCSGYLNQFNKFVPAVSARCPAIKDLSEAQKLDDTCLLYLPKIKTCAMPTSLPTNLSSSCQQFIQNHASYSGCVNDHKNDKDFDGGEWRVFFERTSEFWASRNETIKVIDKSGNVLAETSY